MNEPGLLIILGAGASKDFCLTEEMNMPLTNELVTRIDSEISKKYEEVNALFSRIRPMVTNRNLNKRLSFEESLKHVPDKIQLLALRFYLHDYFQKRSNHISDPVNNYNALLTWIDESKYKDITVVSFNYDTLFEKQIGLNKFKEMVDYINKPLKLIKPHGSSNWFYVKNKHQIRFNDANVRNEYEFLKADFADGRRLVNLSSNEIYTEQGLSDIQHDLIWKIPAIAIPVQEDKKFICPEEHIQQLSESIRNASKILIIGWSASDQHLIDLMRDEITESTPTYIVAGSLSDYESIIVKLREIPYLKSIQTEIGFTDFLSNPKGCKEFFDE